MMSCDSYQSIKTPDDYEEEEIFNAKLQELLDLYDYDVAGCSFKKYRQNCLRRLYDEKRRRK